MRKPLSVAVLMVIAAVLSLLSITAASVAAGETIPEGYGTASPGQKTELAGPAVSQEQALQIASEMFPDLFEGRNVDDIQLQDPYMGEGSRVWLINWSEQSPVGGRIGYFHIGIDADTGVLVNLHCSNLAAGLEGTATPLTREEAWQKAVEYAKKYRPAEFENARLAEGEYYRYYPGGTMNNTCNFYWERVENGIPVVGDGINVGVDLFSGRLVNFTANWHGDAVFPQPGSLPEGLEDAVLRDVGLILCYQVSEGANRDLSGTPEAGLYYLLNIPSMLRISPDNGEALTWDGKTIPLDQYKLFANLPAPAVGGALNEGSGTVARPAQKISQAEAMKAAHEFLKKIGIDQEVVRGGGGSSSDRVFYDETWNYHLKEDNKLQPGQHRQIDVGIDVFSGEVRSYHSYEEYDGYGKNAGGAQKVTRDVARQRALDFIRLVAPEKLGQVVEESNWDYLRQQDGYYFHFVRLVDGIPFLRDGININVSGEGEIINYGCDWHAVKFPTGAGAVTLAEAEKVFREKMRLKPVYFFPLEGENPWPGKQPALALMFDIHRDMGIDARTGQLVAVNTVAAQPEEKPEPVVPAGHWAAAPLAVLAVSGLLPEGDFNPDGPVSRRDAVRVLMSPVGGDYGYLQSQQDGVKLSYTDVPLNDRDYAVVRSAVRMGVLEDGERFFPEQPLAREDLAVWLVRALGYGDVARMPVRIELKAADAAEVSEQAYNYVAIAWGLGLIQGDENGLFRPADQVTWAELASLVTRAAPRLRSARGW